MSTNPISEELPPLPAPFGYNYEHGADLGTPRFTEDQMRAYAQRAIRDRRAADSRANQAVVTEEMVDAAAEALWHAQGGCAWLYAREDEKAATRIEARKALTAALSRAEGQEPVAVTDLEEALRFAEVGEYLYSACAYSYGDGQTEPREYGIEWQWQQSRPHEYGQGQLLAAATRWHEEQSADGFVTEATKLRSALVKAPAPTPTHRHKKSGGEYVLLGIGKMQTTSWGRHWPQDNPKFMRGTIETVDMRPVAIYQSTDDGSFWARPIEEWEDGRFEKIGGA